MKNDLQQAGEHASLDNVPEQIAFEFAGENIRSRPGREIPPRAERGYFFSVQPLETGNGLSYVLKLCQDRQTGLVLSYRLERAGSMPT